MSSLQHCDQKGKGNRSKTFPKLIFFPSEFFYHHGSFSFPVHSLFFPVKGEKYILHLLTWQCETQVQGGMS